MKMRERKIPYDLKIFLMGLEVDDAKKILKWLDENPYAADEMIALICESH